MTIILILAGLLFGCLLPALVGILGSRRKIGFGWAFFLSVIFTPLVGLIVALITDPLPTGERRWGCLGAVLGLLAFFGLVALAVTFLMSMAL